MGMGDLFPWEVAGIGIHHHHFSQLPREGWDNVKAESPGQEKNEHCLLTSEVANSSGESLSALQFGAHLTGFCHW